MTEVTVDQRVREFLEDNVGTHQATDAATSAVYAVLALHKPTPGYAGRAVCDTCINSHEEATDYPCQTIQTIARKVLPAEEVDGG